MYCRGVNIYSVTAFLIGVVALNAGAQTTPQPDPVPGARDSVAFNQANNTFSFLVDGTILYTYHADDGPYCWQTGATLHALTARTANGSEFWPSWMGGVTAYLDGANRNVYDQGVTYQRLRCVLDNGTAITTWRMTFGSQSLDYTYRMHLSSRTLIIQVNAENGSMKATGFTLDRSNNDHHLRPTIVQVPSLTLFNVMSIDGSIVSMFFDWERTNASTYRPVAGIYGEQDRGHTSAEDTSVWYSADVKYGTLANAPPGTRHPLNETIYLTVSSRLRDVLPNLPGPVAPLRRRAASMNILSDAEPYRWSIRPTCDYRYSYLDSLHKRGVTNLGVIMKIWSRYGFDAAYPVVLPANTWDWDGCPNNCRFLETHLGRNGNDSLRLVRDYLGSALGYSIALHENYADYYRRNNDGFLPSDCALGSNGRPLRAGFHNDCGDTSYVLRPALAGSIASEWSGLIHQQIYTPLAGNEWCYLDVHSNINPSDRVDYDYSTGNPGRDSAGMFLYTLRKYRELAGILRRAYGGPVQGEGGSHFLYAGYFDDFEARIETGDARVFGWKAPLLVDFDLFKLHPKSALHGAGQYSNYFSDDIYSMKKASAGRLMQRSGLLEFIATEIAYGHGGLATHDFRGDHSIDQAALEAQLVLPVYQDILDAAPTSVLYGEGLEAASYISAHPDYADANAPGFMSRVRVAYDNGVVVYVNRHPSQPWTVTVDVPHGWYSFHAIINGFDSVGTGGLNSTTFILPAKNGWLVFDPKRTP